MRIALLAPIWERVPPVAYGGIELMVGLLADGLVRRGHEVTLFATGDSLTTARLEAIQALPLRASQLPWHQGLAHEQWHVARCFQLAEAFDLIHSHVGAAALPFGRCAGKPLLTTLHGAFDEHNRELFACFADLPYVSISDAQRRGGPALDYRATVYNGLDTDRFQLGRKQGYLLHLGRVSPEKGTHVAAEVARRTGWPLVIAGKIDPVDQAYYEARVKPLIDGERIRYVGEVGGQPKADLLAGAVAFLHPVQWPEPFGLAMAEAMASGTPVLAFPLGSIPEVVEDGVTGFVVHDADELAAALPRVQALDPATCRRRTVERFGADRMVEGYLAVYEGLLAG